MMNLQNQTLSLRFYKFVTVTKKCHKVILQSYSSPPPLASFLLSFQELFRPCDLSSLCSGLWFPPATEQTDCVLVFCHRFQGQKTACGLMAYSYSGRHNFVLCLGNVLHMWDEDPYGDVLHRLKFGQESPHSGYKSGDMVFNQLEVSLPASWKPVQPWKMTWRKL